VFNRSYSTHQVFDAIRKAKPRQLFVAADGPRPEREGEVARCEEVRQIVTAVDWDCELKTLFRTENLGCGMGVKTAIDWFFENVEQGIILEDDTVPSQGFFSFTSLMLNRYKNNSSIGHICGSNFISKFSSSRLTYYFSIYPMVWGWATWADRWKNNYDYYIAKFQSKGIDPVLSTVFRKKRQKLYWLSIFYNLSCEFKSGKNKLDTWDYQWMYSCWSNRLISVTPSHNLITNIGCGDDATHTKSQSRVMNLAAYNFDELIEQKKIVVSKKNDQKLFRIYFMPSECFNVIRNLAYRYIPNKYLIVYRRLKTDYLA
jgi:hypothetical protein